MPCILYDIRYGWMFTPADINVLVSHVLENR